MNKASKQQDKILCDLQPLIKYRKQKWKERFFYLKAKHRRLEAMSGPVSDCSVCFCHVLSQLLILNILCGIHGIFLYCIVHVYSPFTRKWIVLLYFGQDICTRLEVAISKVFGPPVFRMPCPRTQVNLLACSPQPSLNTEC